MRASSAAVPSLLCLLATALAAHAQQPAFPPNAQGWAPNGQSSQAGGTTRERNLGRTTVPGPAAAVTDTIRNVDLIASPASRYTLHADGVDEVYEQLVCPTQFVLSANVNEQEKQCLVSIKPILGSKADVPWGPVMGTLWSGSIGYWVEDVTLPCAVGTSKELIRGYRNYCTVEMGLYELPPIRRMIPIWSSQTGVVTMGFAIAHQPKSPDSCPATQHAHRGLCEEFRTGSQAHVEDFDVIIRRVAVQGHVILTVATFAHLEYALVWHRAMIATHRTGVVVAVLDLGSYIFLANRGVAVILVPTIAPLNVCCLRKFLTPPFRAIQDVKARVILGILGLGAQVIAVDLDVHIRDKALDFEYLSKFDLVTGTGLKNQIYFSYSAPTAAAILLWTRVLEQVLIGGSDTSQFTYFKEQTDGNATYSAIPPDSAIQIQSNFEKTMQNRINTAKSNWDGGSLLADLEQPSPAGIFDSQAAESNEAQSAVLSRMLASYPGEHSRFVAWDNQSTCTSSNSTMSRFKTGPADWHWRKMCIDSLVSLGLCGQRYLVLPDGMLDVYDTLRMREFFPFIWESSFDKIRVALSFQKKYSETTIVASDAVQARGAVATLQSDKHLVRVSGTPDELKALSKGQFPVPEGLRERVFLYIAPTAPMRTPRVCTRRGGPASDENPDPVCKPRTSDLLRKRVSGNKPIGGSEQPSSEEDILQ